MLKIRFQHNPQQEFVLQGAIVTLGRHDSNDIIIDEADILDFHLEFHARDNSVFVLCLGENNPTLVNDEMINLWRELSVGDVIDFGALQLDVMDASGVMQDDTSHFAPVAEYPVTEYSENSNSTMTEQWLLIGANTAYGKLAIPSNKTIIVGRDADCDIVIREGLVSRHHAEINFEQHQLHVRDLNSTNGTFINAKRIKEGYAQHDDEIRFDEVLFRVFDPSHSAPHDAAPDLAALDSANLNVTVCRPQSRPPTKNKPIDQAIESLSAIADGFYLRGLSTLVEGQQFMLSKPRITVGRSSKNDITLEVANVSVEHAEIVFEDDAWFVNDVGSLNGTFVNEKKILSAQLRPNDVIKFGAIELQFNEVTTDTTSGNDLDAKSNVGRTVQYVQNLFGNKSAAKDPAKKKDEFNPF